MPDIFRGSVLVDRRITAKMPYILLSFTFSEDKIVKNLPYSLIPGNLPGDFTLWSLSMWESGGWDSKFDTAAAAAKLLQSDSVRPYRWHTRLRRPWDSPGKNTGVGCRFLLQCMKVKVKSLSHVRLLVTPWTAAYQAPPPMGFSRQEYWYTLPHTHLGWLLSKKQKISSW